MTTLRHHPQNETPSKHSTEAQTFDLPQTWTDPSTNLPYLNLTCSNLFCPNYHVNQHPLFFFRKCPSLANQFKLQHKTSIPFLFWSCLTKPTHLQESWLILLLDLLSWLLFLLDLLSWLLLLLVLLSWLLQLLDLLSWLCRCSMYFLQQYDQNIIELHM